MTKKRICKKCSAEKQKDSTDIILALAAYTENTKHKKELI